VTGQYPVIPRGIAILSEESYLMIMKGITVKLRDTTLRQLRQEARTTGRSVAALIRERLGCAAPAGPPVRLRDYR